MSLYEIAFHLKLPLYKLKAEMPYDELLGWVKYFEERPVGWRDDDRTYRDLQFNGYKGKPWEVFNSLKPIYNPVNPTETSFNTKSIKDSVLGLLIANAKNGDIISYD